jgi:hypothetical protein
MAALEHLNKAQFAPTDVLHKCKEKIHAFGMGVLN